jgi:inner membrane protein YidH
MANQNITLDTSTKLAYDRTRLAYERTLMAWVRTGVSLISFGFTIYKFLRNSTRRSKSSEPA